MAISKWKKSPLKSLCNRIGDGLHGTPSYDNKSDVFFINGNNLKNGSISISNETKKVTNADFESNYIALNENSLLLSINGTLGEMAFYNDEKVMLGKSAAYLNFKNGINRFYYYYFQLKDVQRYFHNVATGSTIKNLGLKSIQDFEVPHPPEKEWKPIAKILTDIDKKIELNNKINTELEAMAKLIYDYWFVQFDFPSDSPENKGKPYKSSGGKMVYNEELKRVIPEGWTVGNLLEIATFTNGIACQKYPSVEGEPSYKVIKIREMGAGFTDNSDIVSHGIPNKVLVNDGDVLFSWSATLDVKIWTGGIGGLNQHIFKVTSPKYPRTYYYFEVLNYLQHFKMIAELRKTTMGHITQDHLKQSRIAIPPKDLVRDIHDVINPILEKVVKAKEENLKLVELRDWLLPMLMNGQVTVKT
jgi:type I restriction enzyme S subunit